ncbi:hypothetical protein MVEN_00598000 [Mycena venus]|uniref:Uncharacterized protein n=1 Tax=Mycena venus TaxID=2733690 RepID=A0A8H7D890_9AGAR|nr:hypothetical protein MVEN_00598000 [Mycena venus]
MTQVGLGTARNFSSGRPIFQQLADNIPIAGRAFYEADWELNMQKDRQNIRRPSKKRAAVTQASKELLKPTTKPKATAAASVSAESEIEHYFAAPHCARRHHLPPHPPRAHPHRARTRSASRRSSTASTPRTSGRAASAAPAYASSADARGVCTILKVEFVGWSKAEVRGVIGESGTGWCVLEEARGRGTAAYEDDDDDAFSETSSILSGIVEEIAPVPAVAMDPAQSFVLPTLDFSSSFLQASAGARSPSPARTHTSDVFFTHSNSSADSDLGAWSGSDEASSIAFVDPPSENGWFETRVGIEDPWLDAASSSDGGWQIGFSSDFSQRLAPTATLTPEPLESAFA